MNKIRCYDRNINFILMSVYKIYGSEEAFKICVAINERVKPIDELTKDKICLIVNQDLLEIPGGGYLSPQSIVLICEILQIKVWKFVDILMDLNLYYEQHDDDY